MVVHFLVVNKFVKPCLQLEKGRRGRTPFFGWFLDMTYHDIAYESMNVVNRWDKHHDVS